MQTYEAQLITGEVLASVAAATDRDARRLAEGALSGHRLFHDWLQDGQLVIPAAPLPRRRPRRDTHH